MLNRDGLIKSPLGGSAQRFGAAKTDIVMARARPPRHAGATPGRGQALGIGICGPAPGDPCLIGFALFAPVIRAVGIRAVQR